MIFLKLFSLLYADDTVLFSDNEIDMQQQQKKKKNRFLDKEEKLMLISLQLI